MRYMMFVCVDPTGEKYVPEEDNVNEWVDEMNRRDVRTLGYRLKGVEAATTVRWREGKVLVTDGSLPRPRNGSPASIFSSAPTSTRRSTSPRDTPWHASAGSKSARFGRR